MNATVDQDRGLIIRPDSRAWDAAFGASAASQKAKTFREHLGLPTDRRVVMSGHQASIWHPGILAKFFAMNSFAARHGACPVWLVVDHDTNEPFGVRFPVRDAGGPREEIAVREWRAPEGAAAGSRVPTGRRPTVRTLGVPVDAPRGATIDVVEGLHAIARAMNAAADEPNAARQVAAATLELLEARAGLKFAGTVLFASRIARTELFAEVLRMLKQSPGPAVEAYSRAVRENPGAGLADLAPGELPVWKIDPRMLAPRERVTVDTLDPATPEAYAPRAILMTLLLRWCGCDLFIHGTGGAGVDGEHGYDAAAEAWAREWLGAELAMKTVVSATVRLRLPTGEAQPSLEQIVRAQWLAHASGHRPDLLSDPEAAAQRAAILDSLKVLRWKRDAESKRLKRDAYRRLHEVLQQARARNAGEISRLQDHARALAASRRQAEIRADRTWAFPLHEPEDLRDLGRQIAASLGR